MGEMDGRVVQATMTAWSSEGGTEDGGRGFRYNQAVSVKINDKQVNTRYIIH